MERLANALKKRPNLYDVTSKIVAEKYSTEIEKTGARTLATIADRVNEVFAELWDRCQKLIAMSVKEEVGKLQVPERVIREQPQVIERIVVKEVQNALREQEEREEEAEEREEPKVMTIKRDADGLIKTVVKGDKTFTIIRNKAGDISQVKLG